MADQVRKAVENANTRLYGRRKVLHLCDRHPQAEKETKELPSLRRYNIPEPKGNGFRTKLPGQRGCFLSLQLRQSSSMVHIETLP